MCGRDGNGGKRDKGATREVQIRVRPNTGRRCAAIRVQPGRWRYLSFAGSHRTDRRIGVGIAAFYVSGYRYQTLLDDENSCNQRIIRTSEHALLEDLGAFHTDPSSFFVIPPCTSPCPCHVCAPFVISALAVAGCADLPLSRYRMRYGGVGATRPRPCVSRRNPRHQRETKRGENPPGRRTSLTFRHSARL